MTRTLPDILTDDEEQALLATFDRRYPTAERNRLMILLALNTGMRIGDLLGLKWSDIELDTGRCHIKLGKGKKDRVIFIRAEILSAMVDLAAKMGRKRDGLVFTTLPNADLKRKAKPILSQYLRGMITAKAKKAGISKRVHFHLLRHTYLTKLYSRTKDIRLVQEVAGHANIATTQIYTHVSGEDVREAMLADREPAKRSVSDPGSKPKASEALTLDSVLEADPEDENRATEKLERIRPAPDEIVKALQKSP